MNNAELIKALRNCSCIKNEDHCKICGYRHSTECGRRIADDAAAALEAAEQRIAELMPKEGEWIDEQRGRWIYAKCNLCGKVQDVQSNYCPNCGAKMRTVTDCHTLDER